MEDRPLPVWRISNFPTRVEELTEGLNTPNTGFILLGGVLVFLPISAVLITLALLTALYAVLVGHVQVLIWLLLGHLPWFLILYRRQREAQRTDTLSFISESDFSEVWDSNQWDYELSKRHQEENLWVPMLLTKEGFALGRFTFVPWAQFSHYELREQTDDYFVMRLWRTGEESNKTSSSSLSPVDLGLWSPPHAATPLRRFARRVPMIVTILALLVGYEEFGWRADVLVALYLSLFYLCGISFSRWMQKWTSRLIGPLTTPLPYADFAFDNRKVTVEEANVRLQEHLPKRGDWV